MTNISLKSVLKGYDYDQDKVKNPEITVKETLKKLKEVFPDKKFELKNIGKKKLNVYDFADDNSVQRGKGATKYQSQASAIMEYVERFSWKNFDYKNNKTYQKLSYKDLDEKNKLNFEAFINSFIKNNNRELKEILYQINFDFLEGISLIDDEKRLYPLNFNNVAQTSNGTASGNCTEEAILQGLCEVIERHNLTYFLNNIEDSNISLIDKTTIKDELSQNLIKKLTEMNIEIFIVNLTLDFKVPTIMVCGRDNNYDDSYFGFIGYGYGTQADPEKAILRALTEYIQMRQLNEEYDSKSEFLRKRNCINANFQFCLKQEVFEKIVNCKKYIQAKELSDLSDKDFLKELENILVLFKKKKYDVVVIDKSYPKLNIPVVRIWCPNLNAGMAFESKLDNKYLQVLHLLYHSKDLIKTQKFYEKYFDEILFNNNDADMQLLFENYPYLTKDILKKYIKIDTSPYEKIATKDYIEFIN